MKFNVICLEVGLFLLFATAVGVRGLVASLVLSLLLSLDLFL